jgi:nucleotide-binding universal stress UspA family protein
MEKILVGMASEMTSLWAVIYALNLAKRIQAKISVLFIIDPSEQDPQVKAASPIRSQLEKLISDGRLEGLSIDYYLTCGSFKDELIKFIHEKRINLLVIDYPLPDRRIEGEKFPELLEEIKLRSDCRIEVVHPKK